MDNKIEIKTFSIPASAFDPVVEVKELRFGNWLQSYIVLNDGMGKISKECIRPFQVDLKTMELLSTSQGRLFATMEPIPLTAELLIKFGFEFLESFDSPYEIYAHSKVDQFEVWNFNDEHWILDIADQAGIDMSHFKHVHQLQNLYFSLTGLELEINLP